MKTKRLRLSSTTAMYQHTFPSDVYKKKDRKYFTVQSLNLNWRYPILIGSSTVYLESATEHRGYYRTLKEAYEVDLLIRLIGK